MSKNFGGWSTNTAHEKLEHLRELANRRKNGPVTVRKLENIDETDETSTCEEKTISSENEDR